MRLRWLALAAVCVWLGACSGDDSSDNRNNNNGTQSGVCGDGNLDTGEECDNGAANSDTQPDACRTDCRLAWCGDSVIDDGEGCDAGTQNGVSPSHCRAGCVPNVCGDGYVGGEERCDDGNRVSGDGCREDCLQDETLCGNGLLDPEEECDAGTLNSDTQPDACRTDCTLSGCGDGVRDSGEDCDGSDFGTQSCQDYGYAAAAGLACTGSCLVDASGCLASCGNGETEPGEECDDGGGNSDTAPDACRTDCTLPGCGDGVQDSGEACDDGDNIDDLVCSANCQNFCGDNVYNPHMGEECDHGPENGVSPSACLAGCVRTECGDDYVGGTEECDDGNTDEGDGCSALCLVEPRWECWGASSECRCAGHNYGDDCSGCVVFVNRDATGLPPDGRSWFTAYRSVQEGIDAAHDTGQRCEVWVALGTYPIYQGSEGDTVMLRDSVAVYGGFTGGETARAERDHRGNPTVLDAREEGNEENRVFHVVTAEYTRDATLDGFTITFGRADGLDQHLDDRGGGLLAYSAGITVANCTFTGNEASNYGGGMYAYGGAGNRVTSSTFTGNLAGAHGGGISNWNAPVTVSDCTFTSNQADSGGGLYHSGAAVTVSGCTLVDNSATDGGGMRHACSLVTLVDTELRYNTATGEGGGVHNSESTFSVQGGLFGGNEAHSGGAVHNSETTSSFANVTFADNRAAYSGGGINCVEGSVCDVSRSIFTKNTSTNSGGGCMHAQNVWFEVTDSIFAGNSADTSGAALDTNGGASHTYVVVNSVFAGNTAERGAALHTYGYQNHAVVTNCTFVGNVTTSQASVLNQWGSSEATMTNCILWGNVSPAYGSIENHDAKPLIVDYCDIDNEWGGSPPDHNIEADPEFAAAPADTGPWTDVEFDDTTFETVLTDSGATWTPGALAGLFVVPANGSDDHWFYIVDNTEHSIRVPGNLEPFVTTTHTYALRNLQLSGDSPCVDTGSDTALSRRDADLLQHLWEDAWEGGVDLGTPGAVTDMGAYEYVP